MAKAYESVLTEAGFTQDGQLATDLQAHADDPTTGDGSLSHNGEYKVLSAWKKGDCSVHLERNTAPEETGDDMTAIVTHPPLLVIEKGDVRVAVSPRDPEALEAVLSELG